MGKTIAQNIRKLRESRSMSQDDLGQRLNISGKAISSWEIGRTEPNMGYVQAMCDVFGVSAEYLIYGTEENTYRKSGLDYFRIPLYGPLCCGDGGFNDDNIIEYIPVPSKGLSNPDECFCQIAKGDSMKDAGISNGDLLIFQKTSHVDIGVIGCFCIDENESMCKKFNIINNLIMLMPMNSEYEPVPIDPASSNFRCIGKLKKVIKDF